jgi:hypothetical protein
MSEECEWCGSPIDEAPDMPTDHTRTREQIQYKYAGERGELFTTEWYCSAECFATMEVHR